LGGPERRRKIMEVSRTSFFMFAQAFVRKETVEGWYLLTFETESNGYSWSTF
jgi:hypothetical protein